MPRLLSGSLSHKFSGTLSRTTCLWMPCFFITICDKWGDRKYELLTEQGLHVEVMWRRTPDAKGLTGAEIRHRMLRGEPWEHLVPPRYRNTVEEMENRRSVNSFESSYIAVGVISISLEDASKRKGLVQGGAAGLAPEA